MGDVISMVACLQRLTWPMTHLMQTPPMTGSYEMLVHTVYGRALINQNIGMVSIHFSRVCFSTAAASVQTFTSWGEWQSLDALPRRTQVKQVTAGKSDHCGQLVCGTLAWYCWLGVGSVCPHHWCGYPKLLTSWWCYVTHLTSVPWVWMVVVKVGHLSHVRECLVHEYFLSMLPFMDGTYLTNWSRSIMLSSPL